MGIKEAWKRTWRVGAVAALVGSGAGCRADVEIEIPPVIRTAESMGVGGDPDPTILPAVESTPTPRSTRIVEATPAEMPSEEEGPSLAIEVPENVRLSGELAEAFVSGELAFNHVFDVNAQLNNNPDFEFSQSVRLQQMSGDMIRAGFSANVELALREIPGLGSLVDYESFSDRANLWAAVRLLDTVCSTTDEQTLRTFAGGTDLLQPFWTFCDDLPELQERFMDLDRDVDPVAVEVTDPRLTEAMNEWIAEYGPVMRLAEYNDSFVSNPDFPEAGLPVDGTFATNMLGWEGFLASSCGYRVPEVTRAAQQVFPIDLDGSGNLEKGSIRGLAHAFWKDALMLARITDMSERIAYCQVMNERYGAFNDSWVKPPQNGVSTEAGWNTVYPTYSLLLQGVGFSDREFAGFRRDRSASIRTLAGLPVLPISEN